MTSDAVAAPVASRVHRPGLALGVVAAVGAIGNISGLGDWRLGMLLAIAMVLGASFVWLDYGFTDGFRRLILERDGRALGGAFIVPALAALVIVPVGTLVEGYGRYVVPISLPLVLGAGVFGIGMQITNGCGSGTLVAAGQGSRRMWVALPFFCLGGVIGSLILPAAMRLPNLGAVDLPSLFGPAWGLMATEMVLALAALAVLRGAWPDRKMLASGSVIGGLAALLYLVSGQPWGITLGLTLWAAKSLAVFGVDLTGTEFWSETGARTMLSDPILAMHGSLTDVGLVLGALLAAALTGRLRHGRRLGMHGALGAAIGGLLMGVGARLSSGCNIGAFLGGASSGSLHGLVWLVAAIPGCWVGIRLRPLFGLRYTPFAREPERFSRLEGWRCQGRLGSRFSGSRANGV